MEQKLEDSSQMAALVLNHETQMVDGDSKLKKQFQSHVEENWNNNAKQYQKLLSDYVDNNSKNLKNKSIQKEVTENI